MKKLRVPFVIIMVTALALALAGCGPQESNGEVPGGEQEGDEPFESAWEFTVKGSDQEKVFYIESLKEMTATTLQAEKKGETNEYTGVLLSTVLKEAGITEAAEVTLEAADGYTATISGDVAFSDNTILCYMIDGAEITEGKSAPLMLVTTDDSTQVWVGQLKVIGVK